MNKLVLLGVIAVLSIIIAVMVYKKVNCPCKKVQYLKDENGEFVLDANGNKIPADNSVNDDTESTQNGNSRLNTQILNAIHFGNSESVARS